MAVTRMIGPVFFVLTAVADEPRHGYGIVGQVAQLPQGRVRMTIGSLYGVLDRLAGAGLIEPDREEAHDGRPRRYSRLTRQGRARWLRRRNFVPPPSAWCARDGSGQVRTRPDEGRAAPPAARMKS